VFSTFGVTHVAMIADVSVDESDQVHVHRIVCVVDCGTVVNPDTVKAQIEGGIVFGLSAALYGEITVRGGAVQQSNFHDYPILRFDAMPQIEVHILPGDSLPTGIGEMGVPPVAPAIANAIFAATGKRLRKLPFTPDALQSAP
jgi:isoquinoline 1-oxidoreductase beta subunit